MEPLLLLNAQSGDRPAGHHQPREVERMCSTIVTSAAGSQFRCALEHSRSQQRRFSYVSPAGKPSSAKRPLTTEGYIIDGGYFENYGAQTALELARKAIDVIDPDHGQPNHQNLVKLVILQISSDLHCRKIARWRGSNGDDNSCSVTTLRKDARFPNYLEVIDAVGGTRMSEYYVLPSLNELTPP